MKKISETPCTKDYKVKLLLKLLMICPRNYFELQKKKESERKSKKQRMKEEEDKLKRQEKEMLNKSSELGNNVCLSRS